MVKAANNAQPMDFQKALAVRGKTVLGIDIGYSSVNVAQAVLYHGKLTIIKIIVEDIGIVGDLERKKVTIEALRRVLANFNTQKADVVCTISNQKTIVDYVVMPRMPDLELAEAIKIEVSNSQHFSLEDPIFDYQVAGTVVDKNVEKMNVMVAAVAKSVTDNLLSYFQPLENDRFYQLKKFLKMQDFMGLNLVKLIPMSIALENVIKRSKTELQETIVTLEIGSMFTELNIYKNGHLDFFRKINVTGIDFTRSLTSALSTNMGKVELTLQEAELVKREFGIPLPGEDYLIKGKITANQAISLLRPKLEQLTREISRSFDFYYDKNRTAKLDRLVLWGGGAMLKRLPEFLNAELGIPVGIGDPLQNVEFLHEGVLGNQQNKQKLTLAIGAALSDMKGINLLPERLRESKERFFQKIVMIGVVLSLLVISGLIYVILMMKLTKSQQDFVKLKSEYQSYTPNLSNIRENLLLQKFANHRWDMGGVLRELSYLPDKVYLTSFDLNNGEDLTLSGIVLAGDSDSRKILSPVIAALKKAFLQNVKIIMIKEDPKNNNRSNFTITANLGAVNAVNAVNANRGPAGPGFHFGLPPGRGTHEIRLN